MAGAPAEHAVKAERNEAGQQSQEDHVEELEIVHFGLCACSALRNRNRKIDVPRIAQDVEPNPCGFAGPACVASFTNSSLNMVSARVFARTPRGGPFGSPASARRGAAPEVVHVEDPARALAGGPAGLHHGVGHIFVGHSNRRVLVFLPHRAGLEGERSRWDAAEGRRYVVLDRSTYLKGRRGRCGCGGRATARCAAADRGHAGGI